MSKEEQNNMVAAFPADEIEISGREVAESEFDRFAAAWRLDTDVETMTSEDRESFEQQKRKICNIIYRGDAVVTEDGDIIYKLIDPVGRLSEITMRRGKGASYWDMDKGRTEKNIAKLNHYICASIGQPNSVLLKMDAIDVKFIYAVYGLFLGS